MCKLTRKNNKLIKIINFNKLVHFNELLLVIVCEFHSSLCFTN